MIQEHDVVKLKRNLKTINLEGDEISLSAGIKGTVMLAAEDISECVVEFGDTLASATMVTVDKNDLHPTWSPKQPGARKLAS
jgi:preprotein translocase subunit YajC